MEKTEKTGTVETMELFPGTKAQREALARGRKNALRHFREGNASFLMADYEIAEKKYINALLANPKSARALYNLSQAQNALGKEEEAEESHNKALRIDSTFIHAFHANREKTPVIFDYEGIAVERW